MLKPSEISEILSNKAYAGSVNYAMVGTECPQDLMATEIALITKIHKTWKLVKQCIGLSNTKTFTSI